VSSSCELDALEGTKPIRPGRGGMLRRLCEYLSDILIRSTSASSCSVCHLGAAIFTYAHNILSPGVPIAPSDEVTFQEVFCSQLDHQRLLRCMDVIRQCHEHALIKPNGFLERRYGSSSNTSNMMQLPISITQFSLPSLTTIHACTATGSVQCTS